MIIDSDLVVKVGDGIAIFEEPSLRDWATMLQMGEKTLDEQVDILIPKIKEVHGFEYKDGSKATLEDIRNKKFSAKFFLQLIRAWTKAIVEGLQGEAEGKKDETIN